MRAANLSAGGCGDEDQVGRTDSSLPYAAAGRATGRTVAVCEGAIPREGPAL
jgi:hypothetical protein